MFIVEKGKKKMNTLSGNSNFFEWTWPIEGEFAGYIQARSLPNIGKWNNFSPAKLQQLQKKDLPKPQPAVSAHSTPQSCWNIPLPHASRKCVDYYL
jgi:hypothetical protein